MLVGAESSAASDRIDLRDGKSISGEVQSENATGVLIQSSGSAQTVNVNRIATIHYDGQPAVMTHAKAMEESARLAQAADEFAKAQTELKSGSFAYRAAQFGEARARARLALDESGDADDAVRRLEEFERLNPDSRQHFAAQELLGRLYLAKGLYARAAETFETVASAPWPESKLRSAVLHARTLAAQGKYEEALERLDHKVESATGSIEQEIAIVELLLETAHCLRGLNRHADEAAILRRAIDRVPASATEIEAEAYVLYGDANRSVGQPREAVWAYLHVQLLFARHEELHARALYNLWELWNGLDRPERAASAASALESEHPKSPWTMKLTK